MVSMPLCLATIGLSLCQPTVSSEDITQQKHYSEVTVEEMNEILEEALAPISYTRSMTNLENILDTYEYVEGYYAYVEEQERIAEEQRKLEEEQRRLVEEERQRELERIAWENRFDRKGYRQTYYSVVDGEETLGSMHYYGHSSIRNINNIMHYNDSQYGWLPIYAINMNEVMANGQNSNGTWSMYGSVIELRQGDKTWLGIVLDSCGACRYADKIDIWVYNNQVDLDIAGVDWRYIRYGYEEYID